MQSTGFRLPHLVGIVAVALLVRGAINLAAYHQLTDDAYIFMRYVENVAGGHGFVFNQGERVMGFTSPLFVLLLSGLKIALPFVSTLALVQIFNYLVSGIAIWCGLMLFQNTRIKWVAAAMLTLYYPLVDGTLNGMETSLAVALIAGCLLALQRERWGWCVALSALATLTRPECIMLVIVVAVYVIVKTRKALPLVWAPAILGTWAAFAVSYFGTFIPQSMLAKSALTAGPRWTGDTSSLLDKYTMFSVGAPQGAVEGSGSKVYVVILVSLLVLPFFVIGLRAAARSKSVGLVSGAAFIAILAFYQIGNPVGISGWHVIAPSFLFLVTALLGVESMELKGDAIKTLAVGLACASIGTIAVGIPRRQISTEAWGARYERLAAALKERVPNAKSAMIADIGIVAYRTGWKIYDPGGLVSPEMLKPDANGQRLSMCALIEKMQPDIVCLHSDLNEPAVYEAWMGYKSADTPDQLAQFHREYTEFKDLEPLYGHAYARIK